MIQLEQVYFRRNRREILQNINWQVQKGEHWAIVGLNGSGKTTLLNLVNGYLWPTSGKISVFGQTYGEVALQEVRKKIGWVSSSLEQRIAGESIVENLVIGGKYATIGFYETPTHEDQEEAFQLLNTFQIYHLRKRNYQTLSQGEKQKVLITRALMSKPKLLILDEPCTGLDLLSREQVLKMIDQITHQPDSPTLIYVTHHIEEILPCFTHTLLLRKGEVFQAGKTSDLLTSDCLSDFFQIPITIQTINQRQWVALDG